MNTMLFPCYFKYFYILSSEIIKIYDTIFSHEQSFNVNFLLILNIYQASGSLLIKFKSITLDKLINTSLLIIS